MEVSKDTNQEAGLFSCILCDSSFRSDADFVNHMKTHDPKKPFSCTECGKKYTNKIGLMKHVDTHQREPLNYHECGYECTTKRGLSHHLAGHATNKTFTKCDKCDFLTVSGVSLRKHHRAEHPNIAYDCKECHLLFNFKSTFLKHKKKVHSIEKPFSCSMCGNRFTNNSHFKRHMKKHTGDIAIGSIQKGERTASSLISVNISGTFPDKPFDNNDNNDPFINNQSHNEMKNNVEDSQLYDVGEISNSAEKPKCCISCHKLLKCKKSGGKWVINERCSVVLNQDLCKRASRQWGLTTGKSRSFHSNPVGRPKNVTKKINKYSKKQSIKPAIM